MSTEDLPAFSIYDPANDHIVNIYSDGRTTGLQGNKICNMVSLVIVNRIPRLIAEAVQRAAG